MAAMLPSSSLHHWLQHYQLSELTASASARPSVVKSTLETNDSNNRLAAAIGSASNSSNVSMTFLEPYAAYQNAVSELLQNYRNQYQLAMLSSSANQNNGLFINETLNRYLAYLLMQTVAANASTAANDRLHSSHLQQSQQLHGVASYATASDSLFSHSRPRSSLLVPKSSAASSVASELQSLPYGIDTILKPDGTHSNSSQRAPETDAATSMLESFNALLNIDLPKSLVLRAAMPSRAPLMLSSLTGSTLHQLSGAGSINSNSTLGLQFGVFCNQSSIEKGSRFGPFRGRIRHILSLLSQQRHYISRKLHQLQHQLMQQGCDPDVPTTPDAANANGNSNGLPACNYSSWMLFVRCARSLDEANLIAFQNPTESANDSSANSGNGNASLSQLEIYFETLTDIPKDAELVVWYGDLFLQLVAKLETLQINNLPSSTMATASVDGECASGQLSNNNNCNKVNNNNCISSSSSLVNSNQNSSSKSSNAANGFLAGDASAQHCNMAATSCERIPERNTELKATNMQLEGPGSESFQCERCGKVFAYKYYRDKHLKFTRCVDQGDRKFPCHLCNRSFEKRDRLRIHILHVHEKHRPHKCLVCGKCFSQSSSLNKHLRVHTGDRPYRCLFCGKAFTASSILRTHVRLHSGERPFKCKYCGKAFASHAAHDSHIRRTHSQETARASQPAKQLEDNEEHSNGVRMDSNSESHNLH